MLHVAPFGRRSIFFVWAMSEIFSLWVSSWQELHKVSNSSHVLRDWLTKTTTATISTTVTSTSTTATMSTSTRPVTPFPAPLQSSGLLLGALELAFSDPLEVGWGLAPDAVWSFSFWLSRAVVGIHWCHIMYSTSMYVYDLLDLFYPAILCQFAWPTPSVWMIAARCFPVLLHQILRTTTALQHVMSLILCGRIEALREPTCWAPGARPDSSNIFCSGWFCDDLSILFHWLLGHLSIFQHIFQRILESSKPEPLWPWTMSVSDLARSQTWPPRRTWAVSSWP